MANSDLYALASDVLSALATRLTADGIALPERQYVHVGQVAYECELFVVAFESAATGLAGQATPTPLGPAAITPLRAVQLAVHLIRCVPGPNQSGTVSETQLDQAAQIGMEDAWAMMRNTIAAYRDGEFADQCSSMAILGITAAGPQGDFGGVVMRLGVGL